MAFLVYINSEQGHCRNFFYTKCGRLYRIAARCRYIEGDVGFVKCDARGGRVIITSRVHPVPTARPNPCLQPCLMIPALVVDALRSAGPFGCWRCCALVW